MFANPVSLLAASVVLDVIRRMLAGKRWSNFRLTLGAIVFYFLFDEFVVCHTGSTKLNRSTQKFRFKQALAIVLLGVFSSGIAQANSSWVIKRDDKIDSPIFKQRPAIAHQTKSLEAWLGSRQLHG